VSEPCPSCGSAQPHLDGPCGDCVSHPAPHEPYGRFNARCRLCWAEVWSILARSVFIAAWCVGRGGDRE